MNTASEEFSIIAQTGGTTSQLPEDDYQIQVFSYEGNGDKFPEI